MFDLQNLRHFTGKYGRVTRVVVVDTKGSAPREVGAAMYVWHDGQFGSIGGGSLEFQAAEDARGMLSTGGSRVARTPLGPALNQCCGGAVTLAFETFDETSLPEAPIGFARNVEGNSALPGQMKRALDRAKNLNAPVPLLFTDGWLLEPMTEPQAPVVIYGAGHVGQALERHLSPLPNIRAVLADDRSIRPDNAVSIEQGMEIPDAHHLIMTHAHDLDLELCHRLLVRSAASIGLIGSATKWARFSKRLHSLGHSPAEISRIQCPIGNPALGKHPEAIAVGVAYDLALMVKAQNQKRKAC